MNAQQTRNKPVIIDPEHLVCSELSASEHFVFRIDTSTKDRLRDVFLVLPSSMLNKHAELLIRAMKELSNLQVVFVVMDTDFDSFFDKVAEFKVNSLLSKIFRVDRPDELDRVLHAWCNGFQNQRFASVRVEGRKLLAKSCDLTKFEIDLSLLPMLREIDSSKLQKPLIESSGERISWPDLQIDIDFDTLRYHADEKYRLNRNLAALEYYRCYGKGIRTFRENLGLTQEGVSAEVGISTRHLSRVENNEQKLTAKLMEKLASVHGYSLGEYLELLIQFCSSIEDHATRQRRARKP